MIFVVAVDASPMAGQVVDHAVEFARRWEAELHIVHVFHPPVSIYALESGFAYEVEALSDAERQAVWDRVTPHLEASGVAWTQIDLQGHPPAVITAHAAEVEAELIVVGTRGRGDLASLVLGSTSHGVIHSAPCNVLVVRAAAT